jgi:hypothetical protein
MISVQKALATMLVSMVATATQAQTLTATFASDYQVADLGTPPGVPGPLGGLFIRADQPNTLFIGGAANTFSAKVYAVPLVRDGEGQITGFAGSGVVAFNANGVSGGIDGGLQLGPGGVWFYSTYNDSQIGQVKPGSTSPDTLIALNGLGVAPSTGALTFVPQGFPGAGRLKILSYNSSRWYDTTVTPIAGGTYAIAPVSPAIQLGGGLEGAVYIAAGNPQFPAASVLVSEYQAGRITAYEIDGNGDPIVATNRPFIIGLSGAEGAALDPVSGDFLFSTFNGGNRVIAVGGFAATPCLGDLNGDGQVAGADLAILLGAWGPAKGAAADLDDDGDVDAADLAVLLSAWGPC